MKKVPAPPALKVDYEKGPDKKPEQMKMTADGRPDRDGDGIPDDEDDNPDDVDDFEYIPAQRFRGIWWMCTPMPCPFIWAPVFVCPDGDHKLNMTFCVYCIVPLPWKTKRLMGSAATSMNLFGKTTKKDNKETKYYMAFDNECVNCFCSGDPTDGTVQMGDCPVWSCRTICLPSGPRWKHTDPTRTV